MAETLTPAQARAFYDRFGALQDSQAFYEDRALDELVAYSAFDEAHSVFEFGCGTGRFAARLLASCLPDSAEYHGVDISSTMVELARKRLAPFGSRARVRLTEGPNPFAGLERPVDRVVSTYVLDLLPEGDIAAFVAGSAAALGPHGRICLVSLTNGRRPLSRMLSAAWRAAFSVSARLVGGCRPIELREHLRPDAWRIAHHAVVTAWAVPSEVVVAEKRGPR